MRFVVHQPPRRPPPLRVPTRAASYRGLHRVADAKLAAMARVVRAELKAFKDEVKVGDLVDALSRQRQDLAEGLFDWNKFRERAAAAVAPIIRSLVTGGGAAASENMFQRARVHKAADDREPKQLATWMIFRAESPEAERYALEHAGKLIQGVTTESMQVVRDAIAMYVRTGVDYGKGAQGIKDAVGLTRQSARAVEKYRDGLAEGGMKPERVEALVNIYAEKLLKLRAETISRTETIAAVNQGQAMFWEQLMGAGAVDRGIAMKEWITTPDDRRCRYCEDMDGTKVGVSDKFMTPFGAVDSPPMHPNCRCAVNLLPDGDPEAE